MGDLRTRILHALIDNTPAEYLAMPNDLSRIVDAVIEELDLGIPCAADGCKVRRLAKHGSEKRAR